MKRKALMELIKRIIKRNSILVIETTIVILFACIGAVIFVSNDQIIDVSASVRLIMGLLVGTVIGFLGFFGCMSIAYLFVKILDLFKAWNKKLKKIEKEINNK